MTLDSAFGTDGLMLDLDGMNALINNEDTSQ